MINISPAAVEVESLSSESVEEDRFSEKSYNGLFTKRQTMDIFLFILFMPCWLVIVSLTIFIMFMIETIEISFMTNTRHNRNEYVFCTEIYRICAIIQLLDFIFIFSHKIMNRNAKRRSYRSIPSAYIILDIIALALIFSHYAPIKINLAVIGIVLRFYRVYCYFYNSTVTNYKLSFFKLIILHSVAILYILQISVCIWKYINCDAISKDKELTPLAAEFSSLNMLFYNKTWKEKNNYDYLICLFYTTGAFTRVGYGFVRNKKSAEHLFISLIAIVALIIFAMFIAINANNLEEKYRRKCTFWYKLNLVLQDVNHRNIPRGIKEKVLHSYEIFWLKERGQSSSQLFNELPTVLQRNVQLDIYWNSLIKAHIFNKLNPLFLRSIASIMKSTIYYKDDVIYNQGDLIMSYLFVAWGSIRILSAEDAETTLLTLGMNSCLGGFSLIYSYNTSVQIVADSYCVIHSLHKRDFWKADVWSYRLENKYRCCEFMKARIRLAKQNRRPEENTMYFINRMKDNLKYESQSNITKTNYLGHINCEKSKPSDIYFLSKVQDKQYRDEIFFSSDFPWKLNPQSQFLYVWNMIVIGIASLSFSIFTYESGLRSQLFYTEICNPLVTIVYIADVLIQSVTVIEDREGVHSEIPEIFAMRCNTIQFLGDFVAAIPLLNVAQLITDVEGFLYAFLYMNKLVKMNRILMVLIRFETNFLLNVKMVKLLKYLILLTILTFSFGTVYLGIHLILKYEYNYKWTWRNLITEQYGNNSNFESALFMYYYVLTNLTLITPIAYTGTIEMIFLIVLSFIGVILTSYIASDFSAVFIITNELREVDGNYLTICDSYLNMKAVNESVRIRVIAFLGTLCEFCKFGLNRSFLKEIPKDLYGKVHLAKYLPLCLDLPIFKKAPIELVKEIVKMSKIHYFPPNEFLVYSGEYLSRIFIIEGGYCKVLSQHTGIVKEILRPMDHFGVIESVLDQPVQFDIQTYTSVTTLVIKYDYIKRLCCIYPQFEKDLKDVIAYFTEPALERVFRNTLIQNSYDCDYSLKVTSWVVFDNTADAKKMERYTQEFVGFAFTAGKYLMHRTLMPDGDFLVNWEFVYNMAAVIGAIVIPGRGFVGPIHPGIEVPLYLILYIIYIVSIYLRLHVCYYNENQILISHPIYTAKHYIYGSFLVDFIAILPISEFVHCLNKHKIASLTQLCCLSKLLLLYRFPEIHFKRDMIQKHKIIIDLLYFISLAAVFVVNCGYILHIILLDIGVKDMYINNYLKTYYLMDLAIKVDNPSNTPLQELPNDKFIIHSPWFLYLYSIYWCSMLFMGTGTGMILFKSISFYIFNIIITVLGYFFNIWMIAKLCSRQIQINKECVDFQGSIYELMEMMDREKISLTLQKKIYSHFEYFFSRTHGFNTTGALLQCSLPLQQSLAKSMYGETLLMVSVFDGMPNAFMRNMAIICSERHYLNNIPIFIVNDVIDSIYIVHSGTIRIKAADGSLLGSLEKGSMFGNIDKVANTRSMISAIPSKNTDILSIKTTDFFEAIKRYPLVERRIVTHISTKCLFYILCSTITSIFPIKYRQSVINRRTKTTFLVSSLYKAIVMLVSLLTYLSTIYMIAFVKNTKRSISVKYMEQFYGSYKIGFYGLEGLNLLITLLGFWTPIIKNGELLFRFDIVSRLYIKSPVFIINVLALLPIYEFCRIFKLDIYYVRYLLLNRAFRLYNVHTYLNTMSNRLIGNIVIVMIVAITVYMIVIIHTMVCFTYWATTLNRKNSWINPKVCADNYVCTVYYVTSAMAGVGFIEIRASSPIDIIVFIILAFYGRFVLAILIGNLCRVVKHTKYRFFKFADARHQMLLYLCDKLSKPLLKHVVNYYNQLWLLKYAHQLPVLLTKAPPVLVEELFTEAYGYHIYNNSLFINCHPDFKRLLIRTMNMRTFFPGDVIMKQRAIGNKLFFIHRGLVEVLHEESTEDIIVDILEEGDSFGLLELLYPNLAQTHTFRAILVTEVLYVVSEELENLLQFYPASKYNLYEVFRGIDINSFRYYTV